MPIFPKSPTRCKQFCGEYRLFIANSGAASVQQSLYSALQSTPAILRSSLSRNASANFATQLMNLPNVPICRESWSCQFLPISDLRALSRLFLTHLPHFSTVPKESVLRPEIRRLPGPVSFHHSPVCRKP